MHNHNALHVDLALGDRDHFLAHFILYKEKPDSSIFNTLHKETTVSTWHEGAYYYN